MSGGPAPPVFVVGASRSGTNLLRALLNRNGAIWVSAETHYFDDLRPRLPGSGRERLEGERRDACERYFLAQGHRAYGRGGDPAGSRIGADELRALAGRLGGTGDAYFEAFCTLRARLHGRPAWGEKTPRHVYRIAEMLEAFPQAKVVCLVRDPRAVVASYRDWHRAGVRDGLDEADAAGLAAEHARSARSYDLVLMCLLWRAVVRAGRAAQARFGPERVRLQSFERLPGEPEESVRDLCAWLGLAYEPRMLEVPVVNSSYRASEPGAGPSREAVDRWRATLSPREVAIVQRCCGAAMAELGYRPDPVRVSPAAYALAWATVPLATARAGLVNRRRLGKAAEYVRRRGTLAFARGAGASG